MAISLLITFPRKRGERRVDDNVARKKRVARVVVFLLTAAAADIFSNINPNTWEIELTARRNMDGGGRRTGGRKT